MVYINNEEISKKELNRISKRIVEDSATEIDFQKLSDFRAEHSKIIKRFVWSLRSISNNKKINLKNKEDIIISQRLKRLPSIIEKLKRFPELRLARIQDLAGSRIILSSIEDVNKVAEYLRNRVYKQPENKNNFIFLREKDYIKEPKKDGYRSIHQIYKFHGENEPKLNGYLIELQLRTKLQHQWATSVEIIDTIKQQSLKTGGGDEYYKEFFKISSLIIQSIELKSDIKKIEMEIKRLKELNEKYNILKTLSSLRLTADHLREIDWSETLILILDFQENSVSIIKIPEKNISKDYLMYEKAYKNENNNVVSVSVESFKKLKKAYPNYFLDAKEFVNTISKYIEKL